MLLLFAAAFSAEVPVAMLPLHADHAEATSYLKSNWSKFDENYHPNYAVDGNPATAWTEGVEGLGEGQALTIPLSKVSGAHRVELRIWNGYQKTSKLLAANASPREVKIDLMLNGQTVKTMNATLVPKMGEQIVDVQVPERRSFDAVRITVVSSTPGKTYQDLCISDVSVSVDVAEGYSSVAETAKQSRLKAWVGERKAAAKEGTSQARFVFASTKFTGQHLNYRPREVRGTEIPFDLELEEWSAHVDANRALIEELKKSDSWWVDERQRPPAPLPDGLWMLSDVQRLLVPSEVTWSQVTDVTAGTRSVDDTEGAAPPFYREPAKVLFYDAAHTQPRAVLFETHQVGWGRSYWPTDDTILVKYHPNGDLDRVWIHTVHSTALDSLLTFTYQDHQISSVAESRLSLPFRAGFDASDVEDLSGSYRSTYGECEEPYAAEAVYTAVTAQP